VPGKLDFEVESTNGFEGVSELEAEPGEAFEDAPGLESEPPESLDDTVRSGCGGFSGPSAARSWI
jgi:hypothetical protein